MEYQHPPYVTQDLSCLNDVMGECGAIQSITRQISQIAPTNCTVLIEGETGTGKGLIAQCVYEQSTRTHLPLLYMNCATPPESGIEAELFGHHKRVLSGQAEPNLDYIYGVNGQTLLIDEVSELSPEAQANFLEVLELIEKINYSTQHRSIDLRLIVTSQYDLKQLVKTSKFDKRLYYHLSVFVIHIPPLRARGADRIHIAEKLLAQACSKYQKVGLTFAADAIEAISRYHWPGNYRELRNSVERSAVLAWEQTVGADLFELEEELLDEGPANGAQNGNGNPRLNEENQELSLENYFQHFVLEHQDHMTETELAQKLGISRKCLWERRQRLGIPRNKNHAR